MTTLNRFINLAELLSSCAAGGMVADIDAAADLMRACIDEGGKILICGNGGSAAHAQHLASEIMGRFQVERDGYQAVSLTTDTSVLTAIGNDYGFENIFSRQVKALGSPGDMLVAITTSGRSTNVATAILAANARSMPVVLLTGGSHAMPLEVGDIAICVPSDITARIQEVHQLVIHCLCERIEEAP